MSIIKFGDLVVGARGAIGGVIYSANKSGPYVRSWARGSNVRSARQTDARALLVDASAYWRDLDPGDQADWDTWAADPAQERFNALGESYYLSGFQAFIFMSRQLLTLGRAIIESAPLLAQGPAPTIDALTITTVGPSCVIEYPLATFSAGIGYDMVLECSVAAGPGNLVASRPYKIVHATQTPGDDSEDFTTGFVDRFSAPLQGQRIFARLYRQTAEGYRSAAGAGYTDVSA